MVKIKPEIVDNLKTLLKDSHKSSPLLMAFISSALASIGLATNSGTTILGAMLMSPISSLIIKSNVNQVFTIHNIKYTKKYNTFIFPLLMIICVTLITSIIFGYIFHEIENRYDKQNLFNWPTKEMKERANPVNIYYMIFIAIICGVALPFSLIMNNGTKLIAIGIATALTPPLANIGLGISLKLYNYINDKKVDLELNKFVDNSVKVGFTIFIVNLILLYLPTRFLLNTFIDDNNIFKTSEKYLNIKINKDLKAERALTTISKSES